MQPLSYCGDIDDRYKLCWDIDFKLMQSEY